MIPSWINKKTLAWSLYDFADTAFSALFITLFFPILIKVHLGGNEFQIGLALGISVILTALLVPFVGAISDAIGRRMPILIWAALATAAITVAVGYSGLVWALILGFLAQITHLISKDVYDAKMIDLVPQSLYGAVSGLGVGVGYLGAVAGLAVGYILLSYFGWESVAGIQAVFWEAAAFYIIFSLPLFFLVPDKVTRAKMRLGEAIKRAVAEVKNTVLDLPLFPVFARFLAASFFYNNGMNAAIIFLALYAREAVGLGVQSFFPVFALMALSAAIGSFFSGRMADKFGPPTLIRPILIIWIGIILWLIFAASYTTFLAAGVLGGTALGAIWTLNRHMIASIGPEEKIAEFFGFEGLTEKFSGALGPIIFGYFAAYYGYTPALISVIIFFILGIILLRERE